jgi:tetratricopeptide (TPR) repeat protein
MAIAVSLGLSATAQRAKIVSAYNYLDYGELDKAKASIDIGITDEKASILPRSWYYRGLIYQALHESKNPEYAALDPNALNVAYESYLKCMELDVKEKHKNDIKKKLDECARLFTYQGARQFNKSDFDNALQSFENAIKISARPEFAQIDTMSIYNAGITADRLGKNKESIAYYTRLIDLNYGGASTYSLLIKIHRIDSNDAERIAVIQKGREVYPDDSNIIIEELKYYNDKQDRNKSIEILKIAIEKDPDNVVLYYWLGTMHDQAGDFEQGEKVFARALALAEPEYRQQKEAYKLARGTETERSSKAALDKIHENYFNILYNFGALYYNKGVAKLKIIEDIKDNRVYKTERDKAEGIMVKALPLLEKALELKPTDRSTITSLKDLYARTEDNVNWERMQEMLEN